MRKTILLLMILLFIFPTKFLGKELNCPNPEKLVMTTEKDKDELVEALNEIVPKIYGDSPDYREWNIEMIEPMTSLSGSEDVYYHIAVTFCGKEVADHSWFVRLRFPRLLPAESASLGELFIVKNKSDKWFAWFQYH